MEKNDIALSLGIPTVVILISLFLFTSIQPYGLQLEQQKVMAQQELQKQLQPQQELTQKVP
ncbi:MAG TPA: hypothetical protein VFY68_02840, partial [Nitrososphaeraceae archaeon]|nr:hypothetical protein [Nitrososphaeraceae archaeon]